MPTTEAEIKVPAHSELGQALRKLPQELLHEEGTVSSVPRIPPPDKNKIKRKNTF